MRAMPCLSKPSDKQAIFEQLLAATNYYEPYFLSVKAELEPFDLNLKPSFFSSIFYTLSPNEVNEVKRLCKPKADGGLSALSSFILEMYQECKLTPANLALLLLKVGVNCSALMRALTVRQLEIKRLAAECAFSLSSLSRMLYSAGAKCHDALDQLYTRIAEINAITTDCGLSSIEVAYLFSYSGDRIGTRIDEVYAQRAKLKALKLVKGFSLVTIAYHQLAKNSSWPENFNAVCLEFLTQQQLRQFEPQMLEIPQPPAAFWQNFFPEYAISAVL